MVTDKMLLEDYTRLTAYWEPRQVKMREWLALRRLDDVNYEAGKESIVVNTPVTTLNMAIHLLSSIPATHRIPVSTQTEEERLRISRSERGIISTWRKLDEHQMLMGKPPFMVEMLDFALWLGWINVFAGVVPDKDGNPKFFAENWNPYDCFPEYDYDGLCTHIHAYPSTLAEAKAKARLWGGPEVLGKDSSEITVIDYWKRTDSGVVNVVSFGDRSGRTRVPVKLKETVQEAIPIFCTPVGGWADRTGLGDNKYVARIGESFLEANATTYKAVNKWMTLMSRMTARIAEPLVIDKTKGAKGALEPSDLKGKKVAHLDLDESAGTLEMHDNALPFANVMVQLLESKIQQGSFPSALFGNTMFTMSGFALNQLIVAALNVLTPYKSRVQAGTGWVDKTWLDGFKDGGFKKIVISGRVRPTGKSGYYQEDWKPSDVPDSTFVDVEIPIAMPSDEVTKATVMRQLNPEARIDTYTLLDEVWKAEDPDLILSRVDEERAASSLAANPMIQQMRMAGVLRDKAKVLREQGKVNEAMVYEMLAEELGAMPSANPSAQPKGMAPPPVPSQVMPPEMTPEVSGEQLAAMLGIPPAGGSPTTPAEMGVV